MRRGGGSRWSERSCSLGGIGPESSQSRGGGSWQRGGTGNLCFGQLRALVGSFAHVANLLFRTIRVVAGGMPGPVADLVSWNGHRAGEGGGRLGGHVADLGAWIVQECRGDKDGLLEVLEAVSPFNKTQLD